MPSLDQLQAFVSAAEQGSFSAASRSLKKAQSAVSTAIINLEIEVGVELFDRSARQPKLTGAGKALIDHARSVLDANREFLSNASSLSEGVETQLNIAIEEGIFVQPLRKLFGALEREFPSVEIEILTPGPNDVAGLLKEGRTDLGLMMEQESYPQGFHFSGVGHLRLLPVCGKAHPLASLKKTAHADLRTHRQLITRSRHREGASHLRDQKSPNVWYVENPFTLTELLTSGIGWALLPQTVVTKSLASGALVKLNYSFQKSEILQGVDVVWTAKRALGPAGQWLLNKFLDLPPRLWAA